MARGYLRPDLTAERFVPDPFAARPAPGSTAPATSPAGAPTATLEFLGRIDHQVKVRGFRIELGEIEAALARASRRARRRWSSLRRDGQRAERPLVAYVIGCRDARARAERAARAPARRGCPSYMVPAGWIVLPDAAAHRRTARSTAGRCRRPSALRRPTAAYEPPRSGLEQAIAGIWQEVLGVERVGVHDNFFDLGGHSLLVPQVQSRLREHSDAR